ncbi:MAG: glycosyl transferase group 1 [Gammaproteobacteria bacterium]|jgi:glycosyltransferase involved in cell wall biosynthesis|nr:glycosyl transferase group 1 [Gammaproteobacteria bacterium]
MARVLDQSDGLGVYTRSLMRQLLSQDPDTRYVIFLASPCCRDLFQEFDNAQTHVMPARSRLLWDQVLVPRAARRFGVDLLFNPKFSLPLFTRIPGVFVLQSCDWYVNPRNYPWWDNFYIRLMLPLYCRKASGLLAISQTTLDELSRRMHRRFTNTAITHAGVGPNFTPGRDVGALAFRDDYGLPERFILTVARVLHTGHGSLPAYPGGNNERLIRAYGKYRQRTARPLPLVVAGRGVEQYLRAHGFGNAGLEGVRFIGFVPNERLHAAYQLADCFVLATLCESFGLPTLEALATGCPAIVPATGAGPEVAGPAARLIDPYDEADIAQALLDVTGSKALREHLSHEGIKRAQSFTWQQAARRTLDVFDALWPAAPTAAPASATHT